jgi:hypothetical protein
MMLLLASGIKLGILKENLLTLVLIKVWEEKIKQYFFFYILPLTVYLVICHPWKKIVSIVKEHKESL